MKNELKCRVCGYIIREDRLGEVCPACGVAKTAFEPYSFKMSEMRRRLLELHLHPIAVHFPQAFLTLLAVLVATALLAPAWETEVLPLARLFSLMVPLFVLGAAASGIIDGKTRLKKLTTIILRRKIIMGSLLFLLTAGAALVLQGFPFQGAAAAGVSVLLAAGLGCSAVLAKLGSGLVCVKMPG